MSDTTVRIHRAGPEDSSRVMDAAALFDEAPRPAAIERFLGSDDHHLLFALDGEQAVGFVSGIELTHPDKGVEMFLYELGVAEGARRRGVGTTLVEALARLARERGCRGMWVLTDEDNEAAVATYRRAGATIEERTLLLEWRI